MKRRSNDSPCNPPATKCPRRQGLTRNNVSKIVKLVLDAINDDIDDTDQDAGEIETPTAEETEDESVTREVQNSIGMYRIIKRVLMFVTSPQMIRLM